MKNSVRSDETLKLAKDLFQFLENESLNNIDDLSNCLLLMSENTDPQQTLRKICALHILINGLCNAGIVKTKRDLSDKEIDEQLRRHIVCLQKYLKKQLDVSSKNLFKLHNEIPLF